MCNLEHENHTLIQELKRSYKVESIHEQVKNDLA